jgi:hypothetical protein
MERNEHVKLLTQTAATLLQTSASPFSRRTIELAVEEACEIVEEAIKAAKSYEETGGLYE